MLLTHALALSADQFFNARKSPYEYVHSVRIELAKLILVGTRITYQATGDAGYICMIKLGTRYLFVTCSCSCFTQRYGPHQGVFLAPTSAIETQ